MTTPGAAIRYEHQHLATWGGLPFAVYNPDGASTEFLPVIYGFSNGGSPGWLNAMLLAEDGAYLGGHICSSEGYIPHDLGLVEGARPDRHEGFKEHFPGGYRMEFVREADVREHPGISAAYKLNQKRKRAAEDLESTS